MVFNRFGCYWFLLYNFVSAGRSTQSLVKHALQIHHPIVRVTKQKQVVLCLPPNPHKGEAAAAMRSRAEVMEDANIYLALASYRNQIVPPIIQAAVVATAFGGFGKISRGEYLMCTVILLFPLSSQKLSTVYETVTCMQQLCARYALRICYYAHVALWWCQHYAFNYLQCKLLSLPLSCTNYDFLLTRWGEQDIMRYSGMRILSWKARTRLFWCQNLCNFCWFQPILRYFCSILCIFTAFFKTISRFFKKLVFSCLGIVFCWLKFVSVVLWILYGYSFILNMAFLFDLFYKSLSTL